MSKIKKVPCWDKVREKLDNGKDLNPIEKLIYDHCPAGIEKEKKFIRQVSEAINYEDEDMELSIKNKP